MIVPRILFYIGAAVVAEIFYSNKNKNKNKPVEINKKELIKEDVEPIPEPIPEPELEPVIKESEDDKKE